MQRMTEAAIRRLSVLSFLLLLTSAAHALEGVRAGDCYTTADGVNHCGESSSTGDSSSSSYGWTYTYGYTDSSAASGPSWAERQEANRLRQEALAWQKIQQEAVRINQIGLDYANQGNYDKAAEFYEQAHNTDPSDPVILNNLNIARSHQWNNAGNRYWEKSDWVNAVDAYQKAVDLRPDNEVLRQHLEDAKAYLKAQQEAEAADQRMKDQLSEAGAKMKEKLAGIKLGGSTPAGTPSSGLSFKAGQEEPSSSLAFKNRKPAKNVLEADEERPDGGSKSVLEQLKSVWFHSKTAKEASSDESASGRARLGLDTKGVHGGKVDVSEAMDASGLNDEPALQFKPLAQNQKAEATQVPEFDPTLSVATQASPGPEFDPTLSVTPLPAPGPEFDPSLPLSGNAQTLPDEAGEDLVKMMLHRDASPAAGAGAESKPIVEKKEIPFVPLSEENWEIIKKDPEVHDALLARDTYYREHERKLELAQKILEDAYGATRKDLLKKPEYKNAAQGKIVEDILKNQRVKAAVSDYNALLDDERRAWQDHEQTIAANIEKKRLRIGKEILQKENR